MNKPNQPHEPGAADRLPGRSFSDPKRPLGEDVIERADPHGGDPEEGFYGRAAEHFRSGHGIAERAKVVAVLRKAEELMASGNPSGRDEDGRRRAIELACGRCGVLIADYDRYLASDDELRALHAEVMASAESNAAM
jgi:hypothetical protein